MQQVALFLIGFLLFVGQALAQETYCAPTGCTSIRAVVPGEETIAAAATITADACGSIKLITTDDGGAVTTNTTNTFTAPALANDGCIMRVCNNGAADAITLDANANFRSAAAGNVVLGVLDCVTVGSTGASGIWIQLSPLQAN